MTTKEERREWLKLKKEIIIRCPEIKNNHHRLWRLLDTYNQYLTNMVQYRYRRTYAQTTNHITAHLFLRL